MKKQSAILEILYGNNPQFDNLDFGPEFVSKLHELRKCENALLESLKDTPECDRLKKYSDIFVEIESIENDVFYKEGFRLGFLLAMDIFDCK